MSEVTLIIERMQRDEATMDDLLPLVYAELRTLAAQKMTRESPDHTLQATALVHEAYLRLVKSPYQKWQGRAHFFSAAAEAMRRILIEKARRKLRLKRNAGEKPISLESINIAVDANDEQLLAVDEALDQLAEEDPVKADLVKLRFYTGMNINEAAEALGISRTTAKRYWNYARAWLFEAITDGEPPSDVTH